MRKCWFDSGPLAMLPYYVVGVLLLAIAFLREDSRLYILGCVGLLSLSSARAPTVGIDLKNYLDLFYGINSTGQDFEIAFMALLDSLHAVNESSFFFIASMSFLTLLPVFYVVYRATACRQKALFFYYVMLFYFFTLSGIRQALSISVMLLAIFYLARSKYFVSAFFAMLSVLIHTSSAVVALVVLVMATFNIKRTVALWVVPLSFVLVLVLDQAILSGLLDYAPEVVKLSFYQSYLETTDELVVPFSRMVVSTLPHTLICWFLVYKSTDVRDLYLKIYIGGVLLNNAIISLPIGFRIGAGLLVISVLFFGNQLALKRHRYFFVTALIFFVFLFNYNLFARLSAGLENDIVPYVFNF